MIRCECSINRSATRFGWKAEGEETFQRFRYDRRSRGHGAWWITECRCFRRQCVGRAPDPNVRFEIRRDGQILRVTMKLDRLRQAKRAYRLTGHLKSHVITFELLRAAYD
jgi:hypothetical protein